MAKTDNKLTVLRQIRDSKDILFGAFSDYLTKEMKVAEWYKILQTCKALELVSAEKNYSYIRDTFWSNIKRGTLAKKDNAKKTGAAGGKNKKFTPVDDLVLEIIGTDSPIIDGIGVTDLMAEKVIHNGTNILNTGCDDPVIPNSDDESEDQQKETQQKEKVNVASKKKDKKFITKGSKVFDEIEKEKALKKRKLELQVQHLEVQNYKIKLELFEHERKLNVVRSKYTSNIEVNLFMETERPRNNNGENILFISQDNLILN